MERRNEKGLTLSEFLAAYDENKYRRPSVTVDMAVFTLLKNTQNRHVPGVLLIRRKDHPYIGRWALPGGFLNMEEDIAAAAARELREETGISGLDFRQFGTFGALDRDPRTRVISVGHFAVAPYGALVPAAGDDAADAGLFAINLWRSAFTAEAELFDISLVGPETLFARARRTFDSLGSLTLPAPGGDLAADHALLLFSALRALSREPKSRMARLLAGENPSLIPAARRALDTLFFDL